MNMVNRYTPIPFRVIIAGSRDFSDYDLLKTKLDYFLSKKVADGYKIVIVSGAAKGADKLGERYAKERGYYIDSYPADWDRYGKRAGYLRNVEMANAADALIAFWDGVSKGTKHMIDIAESKQLLKRVVYY